MTDEVKMTAFIAGLGIIQTILLRKINYKILAIFLLFIIIPTLSVFITVILHGDVEVGTKQVFLRFINTSKEAIELATYLSVRSVSLSVLSVVAVLGVKYERLVISMMQNVKLPVIIGYPLIAAFNAFFHLKIEFERIVMITKMRKGKKINPFLLLFPLLVSTIRYANQIGLSLESRGLNKNKSFYNNYKISRIDFFLLTLFFVEAVVFEVIVFV